MKTVHIFIVLFFSIHLMGQKYNYAPPQIKEVTINYNDSIAIINVYTIDKKIKVEDNKRYYWYYSNDLNSNIGGYQGMLLNGKFIVLNQKNNLITKGFIKDGVKDGIWKRWYPNGIIKEILYYDMGIKEGTRLFYNETGEKIVEENYRNDLLQGSSFYKINAQIIERKYRKGKLLDGGKKFHIRKKVKSDNNPKMESKPEEVSETKTNNIIENKDVSVKEELGKEKKDRKFNFPWKKLNKREKSVKKETNIKETKETKETKKNKTRINAAELSQKKNVESKK